MRHRDKLISFTVSENTYEANISVHIYLFCVICCNLLSLEVRSVPSKNGEAASQKPWNWVSGMCAGNAFISTTLGYLF